MPQVVFSPTSQNDTTLNELAFRGMSENLAENIKYRRSQQSRKAATAQDLEAKMAAGLIPKSALKVTDEGFEFKDQEAKSAFYDKLGSMFGKDKRSRAGKTEQTSEIVNRDQQFTQDVASAVEANRGPNADYMDAKSRELVEQTLEFGKTRPTPLTDAELRGNYMDQMNTEVDRLLGKGSKLRGADVSGPAATAVKLAEQAAKIQAEQNLKAAGGAPAPAPGPAPAPASTTTSGTKTSVSASATDAEKIAASLKSAASEKASSEYNVEVGGIDVNSDIYAKTRTDKTSERIDEIKTSLTNLLGLSAFENYGNQLLRVNDQNINAPVNNTFGALAEKRAADIERWEKAGSTDGFAEEIKSIGKRQVKTEGSKWAGKVGTAASFGFSPNINISTVEGSKATASSGDKGGSGADKTKVWNTGWGDYRSPDVSMDAEGNKLVSKATNLVINPQNQPFGTDPASNKMFDDYNKTRYANVGVKAVKKPGGVIEWVDNSGTVVGTAYWDTNQEQINAAGKKRVDAAGKVIRGDWNLTMNAGATRAQIEAITGTNFQAK